MLADVSKEELRSITIYPVCIPCIVISMKKYTMKITIGTSSIIDNDRNAVEYQLIIVSTLAAYQYRLIIGMAPSKLCHSPRCIGMATLTSRHQTLTPISSHGSEARWNLAGNVRSSSYRQRLKSRSRAVSTN